MAEEKDKVNPQQGEANQWPIGPNCSNTTTRASIKEQWEQLKAEEKKPLTDEQKKYFGWIASTDPYHKEPGTSKFYLMDEAGAWPIVDPKEFEEARGLNWEQIPKGKYKMLTREELYPNGKMSTMSEGEKNVRRFQEKFLPTEKKNFMDKIIARLKTRPPLWLLLITVGTAFLGLVYVVLKYFVIP